MRRRGDVVGVPLAVAVAAGVEGDHVRALGQPVGRRFPLARVPAQAVEEQHRLSIAAEIDRSYPRPAYQSPNTIPNVPRAGISTVR